MTKNEPIWCQIHRFVAEMNGDCANVVRHYKQPRSKGGEGLKQSKLLKLQKRNL